MRRSGPHGLAAMDTAMDSASAPGTGQKSTPPPLSAAAWRSPPVQTDSHAIALRAVREPGVEAGSAGTDGGPGTKADRPLCLALQADRRKCGAHADVEIWMRCRNCKGERVVQMCLEHYGRRGALYCWLCQLEGRWGFIDWSEPVSL